MQLLKSKIKKIDKLFAACVLAPTAMSIVYYGLISSNVYISESVFVVRRPEKPAATGVGVLLRTAGFSNASDEMHAAKSYVLSRDALRKLNNKNFFENSYRGENVSFLDKFNPTGLFGSFENLYQFYLKKIDINYDTASSISTLSVRAHSSEDAQKINETLLRLTEQTVNRLNKRARTDLILVAQREVDESKRKAQAAALELAAFRNKSGIIDPEKQATVEMQMLSKLQDQLISTETQLSQMRRIAPGNPQIEVLSTAAASLRSEIDSRTREIAGNRGSLSAVAIEYQRLFLESQFADRQLVSSLASLSEARNEARKQQAYIERIAEPSLPDEAMEPRRLRGILATFVLGLIAYGIMAMLLAGVKEHKD